MGNNSVPKFIFRLSRFPVYRGSVLGRFYCISIKQQAKWQFCVPLHSNQEHEELWTDRWQGVRQSGAVRFAFDVFRNFTIKELSFSFEYSFTEQRLCLWRHNWRYRVPWRWAYQQRASSVKWGSLSARGLPGVVVADDEAKQDYCWWKNRTFERKDWHRQRR